ncbi:MAG: LiaI-LiaF-like domain-containing protein [Massilia sp.]
MKNDQQKSISAQLILGAFVVGLGLLFLLDNLNIFDYHRMYTFWPTVFIVLGVVKLLDTNTDNGKLLGSILISVGVLWTLNRLGFVYFNVRSLAPLILVTIGGMVIYRALARKNRSADSVMQVAADSDSIVDITAVLGGFDRRINTPTFRGGEVTVVMAGCQLDLRGSSIEGEAVINVFVSMGGISIKVPVDWTVVLHGSPIMGGFDEKTAAPPNNNKRLIVKGYAIMGGVEIRN